MAKNKFDDMVIFGDGQGGFVSNDVAFNAEEYAEFLAGSTEEAGPYDGLDAKALKALAAEREVDITGLKKVGEVRAALTAADAAAEEESEEESEDDSEDESEDDSEDK